MNDMLINNKKNIFLSVIFRLKKKVGISFDFRLVYPRSGSADTDPNPDQKDTDPQNCIKNIHLIIRSAYKLVLWWQIRDCKTSN